MDNGRCNRLRELRVHLNMTQKQMADILGVGQNTYSRIENGERKYYIELQKQQFSLEEYIDKVNTTVVNVGG